MQNVKLSVTCIQVRGHMSSTQKELSVKVKERDDEIRVLKEQNGDLETNLGHELREKHELERTVTDLKEEKRRADLLVKKLQDLEGFSNRETQARQQAQEDLKKAQRYAESVSEWDKALQEKVTKLEGQRQVALESNPTLSEKPYELSNPRPTPAPRVFTFFNTSDEGQPGIKAGRVRVDTGEDIQDVVFY